MSTRYYGVNYGGRLIDVAEGSSTNSTDVELVVVYTASNNSKVATINAVEAIIAAIERNNWPPGSGTGSVLLQTGDRLLLEDGSFLLME